MSTFVTVNTYAHTTTFIADKMLRSLQLIVRESGLDPGALAHDWGVLERGIRTWLGTKDLETVVLEVYDPRDAELVGRWDFVIIYGYDAGEDGMWVDTAAIRYAILKAGLWPEQCAYRLVAVTKPGRPAVEGWATTNLRSTDGFARHAVGTTIGAVGAGASTAYWRRA